MKCCDESPPPTLRPPAPPTPSTIRTVHQPSAYGHAVATFRLAAKIRPVGPSYDITHNT